MLAKLFRATDTTCSMELGAKSDAILKFSGPLVRYSVFDAGLFYTNCRDATAFFCTGTSDTHLPHSYKAYEAFFSAYAIEGVVIEHNGRWWKVKSEHFASIRDSPHGWLELSKQWKTDPSKQKKRGRRGKKGGRRGRDNGGSDASEDVGDRPSVEGRRWIKDVWRETKAAPGFRVIVPRLIGQVDESD